MKKNNLLISYFVIILTGCAIPSHVPQKEDLPTSTKGSYIELKGVGEHVVKGELIAIDSLGITILDNTTKRCKTYPITQLTEFKLYYAQSSNYSLFHIGNAILMLGQGFGMSLTLFPYVIFGSAVSYGTYNSYIYTDKIVSLDYIKMFARFPQGLPPGILLDLIK